MPQLHGDTARLALPSARTPPPHSPTRANEPSVRPYPQGRAPHSNCHCDSFEDCCGPLRLPRPLRRPAHSPSPLLAAFPACNTAAQHRPAFHSYTAAACLAVPTWTPCATSVHTVCKERTLNCRQARQAASQIWAQRTFGTQRQGVHQLTLSASSSLSAAAAALVAAAGVHAAAVLVAAAAALLLPSRHPLRVMKTKAKKVLSSQPYSNQHALHIGIRW